MKVVVTGGAGYVGSMLVPELLARGHDVCVYDAMLFGDRGLANVGRGCSIVVGDIRDRQRLGAAIAGADAVIHLAALVGEPACARDPKATADVNVEATQALAEAAGRAGISRMIFSSTCSNYGVSEAGVLATELTTLKPISVYAETKVAAELAVLHAAVPGMVRTVFRLATVFGCSPRMRFDTLLNEFVRDAECAKKLTVYGPSAWRPLIHVRDAVVAFARWLELPGESVAGVFNVVGDNYQKRELAELICEHVDDAVAEFSMDQPDARDYRVSAATWNALADLTPFRTATEGIREMVKVLRSGALGSPYDHAYRNL